MFAELVKELLYSWQNADAEQVEAWANGEAWAELQALAQCQAAQQSAQADKACACIKPWYFPRRVNDQCLECGCSISLATKA